jgi:hypothetical protein
MPIVEELLELEDTSAGVVDCLVMAKTPAPPADPAPLSWWARYSNLVAAVSGLSGTVIALLSLGYFILHDHAAAAAAASDEHVAAVVERQLNPINDKLNALTEKIGKLEGRFEQLDASQRKLEALNKLQPQDPKFVLARIQAEIHSATVQSKPLPEAQLAVFRDAVQAVPPTTEDFWQTVATIINYQSFLNQLNGAAPDPNKVARPCLDENAQHNLFLNHWFQNCRVLLDTESFRGATFQDSVIIYRGGPVELRGAKFINCSFVLELPERHKIPGARDLLFVLLESPDQKSVQVAR